MSISSADGGQSSASVRLPDDTNIGDGEIVGGFGGVGKVEDGSESSKIEVPHSAKAAGYLPWEEDLEMLSFFSAKKVFRIYIPMANNREQKCRGL